MSIDMSSVEARMQELGLELPAPPPAPGNYVAAYVHGDVADTAGHLPLRDGAPVLTGTLGADVDVEDGARAAEVATLNALSSLRSQIGTLDRVLRVVKLRGYVAATADFDSHHLVTNGASDLVLRIFGPEAGAHVRASVGVASLPFRAPVEIELGVVLRTSRAEAEG